MAVLIPDALPSSPIRVPLACDSLIQDANSAKSIRHYLETGDASGLIIPDGAAHASILPLTPARRERASAEAGPMSKLGYEVSEVVHMAGAAGDEVAERDAFDALDDDEKAALGALSAWRASVRLATIRQGVLSVDGWPDDVSPASRLSRAPCTPVNMQIAMELERHVQRVSELSPSGKEQSKSGSGSAGPPSPDDGPATPATPSGDGSGETAAAPSAQS